MEKKKLFWITVSLIMVFLSSITCQSFSGGNIEEMPEVERTEGVRKETVTNLPLGETQAPTEINPENYDTDFPLPEDVQNFQKINEQNISYQTSLSIEKILAFYRQELIAQGFSEVDILTQINPDNFSIVFSPASGGVDIVVQGVQLDPNTLNVNIRYEDV
jgi:hypothetical protein